MKTLFYSLTLFSLLALGSCNGKSQPSGNEGGNNTATPPANPIEAPETPPEANPPSDSPPVEMKKFNVSGTEPFWNISITPQAITYTQMGGDSVRFDAVGPKAAAAMPAGAVRVYELSADGKSATLILEKVESIAVGSNCHCSDGMSPKDYAYTALFLYGQEIYKGCAEEVTE